MNFEAQSESEGPAATAHEQAERAAEQYVQRGEWCIGEHPQSAVSAAFAGGLVIGLVLGWFLAEAHEHDMAARRWRRRFHLG